MNYTTYEINNKINMLLKKYSDTVRRICFIYLKNNNDVEDVFQEVFLKLIKNEKVFESDNHERAWVIRVTINKCKDLLKSFWRKNIFSINDKNSIEFSSNNEVENEILKAVLSLPRKYKDVVYLYYYEGYNVPEIALMLKRNENTIYSDLHKARKILKEKLGGNENDYEF